MIRSVGRLPHLALLAVIGASLLLPRSAAGQRPAVGENTPAQRSTELTLTIGGVSKQLSLADVAAMPQTHVTVHNSHNNRDETYTGVTVYDLLRSAGLPFSKDTQRTYLRSYVRMQGTDFYFVICSAAELSPDLNTSSAIVATHVDGHGLGQDGAFKLVSTGDKRPARWVRNLLSITLVTVN